LLHRYTKNEFSQRYKSTIGADFLTRTITIDETEVHLQLWDTAGPGEPSRLAIYSSFGMLSMNSERFSSLGTAFYRGAEGMILAAELAPPAQFRPVRDHCLDTWRREFLSQSVLFVRLLFMLDSLPPTHKTQRETRKKSPFLLLLWAPKMTCVIAGMTVFALPRTKSLTFVRSILYHTSRPGKAAVFPLFLFTVKLSLLTRKNSAKTGENVEEAIRTLAVEALDREVSLREQAFSIEDPLIPTPTQPDPCCCIQ